MADLTREDWVEIYYALCDKRENLLDGIGRNDTETKKWIAHLDDILEKIGPDGENMTEEL